MATTRKVLRRMGRHQRIRKTVKGTADRPRANVFRSHKHLMVQLINDLEGKTLVSISSSEAQIREKTPYGGNIQAAKELGKILAERAVKKGIHQVVLDRSGYRYHGRIKALAEALREGGLQL